MRRDPSRPSAQTVTPLLLDDVETAANMVEKIAAADLIILLLDETQGSTTGDPPERTLAGIWTDSGARVLVFANRPAGGEGPALDAWIDWDRRRLIAGPVDDPDFLLHSLVPVVLDLLPSEQHIALGRHFPLFRCPSPTACQRDLFSNATYSLSTGLAEIIRCWISERHRHDRIEQGQAFWPISSASLGLSTRSRIMSRLAAFWAAVPVAAVGPLAGRADPCLGHRPQGSVAYSGTYM
jgi:hypothetical protein